MAARIVIATSGSYGDVNPYLGLAIGLRERGHEPVIATSPMYRGHVEREGIAFHPVRPDVNPNDRALVARIMDARRGAEFLLRQLVVPSIRDAYEDISAAADGADLLITHPITFAGPIVAQERGLPWVSTVLAPMSFFSEHDLPVFPPVPWVKRLERVPGASRLLVRLARTITGPWMEPLHALRAELGLPPGDDPLYEGQHSPLLVLALFSRVLGEPQPDWPRDVRLTGPILYNGPVDDGRPVELERFLDAGPPPVVFTLGTSAVFAAGAFYEESVMAARLAGVRAVLLVGGPAENRPTAPPGDDVLVLDHAAHAALLPRAAATVHQGGVGTLQQALRAGRPMIVVPYAHDQADNAYRAARLGVARIVPPRRYRARRVADELRRLLDDPDYARRAASVAATVGAEDGLTAACDALDAAMDAVLRLRTGTR